MGLDPKISRQGNDAIKPSEVVSNRNADSDVPEFDRLVLPTVPCFTKTQGASEVNPVNQLPVQKVFRDEPTSSWSYPFAPFISEENLAGASPQSSHSSYRDSDRMLAKAPDEVMLSLDSSSHLPNLTLSSDIMTDASVSNSPTETPASASKNVIVLFVITSIFLVWASRMAFSPALLAMSALTLAEVARAYSLTKTSQLHSFVYKLTICIAIVMIIMSDIKALKGFSDTAFVASLFVLAATIPTALIMVVSHVVLLRKKDQSLVDTSLRLTAPVRLAAVGMLVLSGFIAKDSFSAKPDAIVTLLISSIALWIIVLALKGKDASINSLEH